MTHNHMIRHCIITCSCCHDPISHNHMTLPTHISNPRPGPITLCYILVAHSTRHMSPLKCIAFPHSVMITSCSLVLSPLWFLCLMHSPHYMLPSICLCSLEHNRDGINLQITWVWTVGNPGVWVKKLTRSTLSIPRGSGSRVQWLPHPWQISAICLAGNRDIIYCHISQYLLDEWKNTKFHFNSLNSSIYH